MNYGTFDRKSELKEIKSTYTFFSDFAPAERDRYFSSLWIKVTISFNTAF